MPRIDRIAKKPKEI